MVHSLNGMEQATLGNQVCLLITHMQSGPQMLQMLYVSVTCRNGDTTISGNLDVGANQTQPTIIAYTNHGPSGDQGYFELKANNKDLATISVITIFHGTLNFSLNRVRFFRMTKWNDQISFYKPTTGSSDDRLKEMMELYKMLVKHYQN